MTVFLAPVIYNDGVISRSIFAAAILSTLIAAAAPAQQSPPFASASEFGRASGGAIEALTKQPSRLSGSFNLWHASSAFGSSTKGFGATAGGTLLKDRMWFFASALQDDGSRMQALSPSVSPAIERAEFAKAIAQAGDHQTFDSSFLSGRSTFLSLRSTTILSSNMFVTASFSRSATPQQNFLAAVPTP